MTQTIVEQAVNEMTPAQDLQHGIETGETCPKCSQPMFDEEIVVMDFAGRSIEHVNCPK